MNFSHKFVFPGALKALLLLASIPLPISFIAGCRHKAVLAADQPVAVRLRAPNHLQEPVSVAASGSVEANLTALTAFQVGGRVARVYVGANIEMAEEAGEENLFMFGLTVEQVENSRSWYNPHWHYDNEPETRAALDLIFSDYFSRNEPGVFAPLRDCLLTNDDHYMHLADLKSYLDVDERLRALYNEPEKWAAKAIRNIASSGKFSSDRTIAEYAGEIWNVQSCPVPEKG